MPWWRYSILSEILLFSGSLARRTMKAMSMMLLVTFTDLFLCRWFLPEFSLFRARHSNMGLFQKRCWKHFKQYRWYRIWSSGIYNLMITIAAYMEIHGCTKLILLTIFIYTERRGQGAAKRCAENVFTCVVIIDLWNHPHDDLTDNNENDGQCIKLMPQNWSALYN